MRCRSPASGTGRGTRSTTGCAYKVGAGGAKVYWLECRALDGSRQSYKLGAAERLINPGDARKLAKKAGVDPAADRRAEKATKLAAELKRGRTVRAYVEGDYYTHVLTRRKSGEATKARILAAWAPFLDTDMADLDDGELDRYRSKRLKAGVSWKPLNRGRIALLALNTGLQRGELFNLTWEKVAFAKRQVTVRAATAKGSKTRVLPLNDEAIAALKAWRDRKSRVRDEDDRVVDITAPRTGLVFPNPETGKPFVTVKRAWASLVADAQLVDFHLHDCRHDFGSRLVQNGVSLFKVQTLLGHSTPVLTMRYAHLQHGHLQEAVEVLR